LQHITGFGHEGTQGGNKFDVDAAGIVAHINDQGPQILLVGAAHQVVNGLSNLAVNLEAGDAQQTNVSGQQAQAGQAWR
jgi:hypothetical protein